jgi:hypothetical protein
VIPLFALHNKKNTTVNFGASLEKNISVPKSTGYRMMPSLDYAKWLAKGKPKSDKANTVLAVLQDASEGGALEKAKAAVVTKLAKSMDEKRKRDTLIANRLIFVLSLMATAGAGWYFYNAAKNATADADGAAASEL